MLPLRFFARIWVSSCQFLSVDTLVLLLGLLLYGSWTHELATLLTVQKKIGNTCLPRCQNEHSQVFNYCKKTNSFVFRAQRSIFSVTIYFTSGCFRELCQSSNVLATDRLFVPKQYVCGGTLPWSSNQLKLPERIWSESKSAGNSKLLSQSWLSGRLPLRLWGKNTSFRLTFEKWQ